MAKAGNKVTRAHPLLAAGLALSIALAPYVAFAESTTATTELTVECHETGTRDKAMEPAQIRRTERGRIPATADATAAGIDAALLVALTALIVGVASRDGPHEGEEAAMSATKG